MSPDLALWFAVESSVWIPSIITGLGSAMIIATGAFVVSQRINSGSVAKSDASTLFTAINNHRLDQDRVIERQDKVIEKQEKTIEKQADLIRVLESKVAVLQSEVRQLQQDIGNGET